MAKPEKPDRNWDQLRQAKDYNPYFAAWFEGQPELAKEIWMDIWVKDDLNIDDMFWWLEKCQVNQDVARAEVAVHNAPAEFQDAADRGDLKAMGEFLAERMRNQAAGLPWK